MSIPESICAIGLTLFWPAYFGAEPCVGSKTAIPSPTFAPGAIPSPPIIPAHRSETTSPYRFGRTRTSYSSGRWTSCMHMLSTIRSSNVISTFSAATSRATRRNSPSVNFMMSAVRLDPPDQLARLLGALLVLDAGVQVLGVLADDHEVEVLEARAHTRVRL